MSKIKSFVEHSGSIPLMEFIDEVRKADSEVDESMESGADIRNIVYDYLMSTFIYGKPIIIGKNQKHFPLKK